jgi:uncharacterized protein
MATNWDKLWQHVTAEYPGIPDSIHGPAHWRRVEKHGLWLAERTGAVVEVVRLFAVLHDSRRKHDGHCLKHGRDASRYAAQLRGQWFELADENFALLQYACEWHTHGQLSADPTIGSCWDADRLDLGRVGMIPSAKFMSTPAGRERAETSDAL